MSGSLVFAEGPALRARSVVLDADSTLVAIEGIDWLAAKRGPAVAKEIAALTNAAMAGSAASTAPMGLSEIYGARLEAVRPSRAEIATLGEEYVRALAPGARECVAALREAGVRVVIVSGGLHLALVPLAAALGIVAEDVRGVEIAFAEDGAYLDFDRSSPLTQPRGKADVVRALELPRPVLAVGDGATDLAIRTARACDTFAAFTGYVSRPAVVTGADVVIESFHQLQHYVLLRGTV